jgi:hypothetical protein
MSSWSWCTISSSQLLFLFVLLICFGPTINKPLEDRDVLQSLGTSRTVEPVEKVEVVEVIKSPLTFFSSYAIIIKQAFGLSGVFRWYRPTSF